ncbi:hypothetical protein O181_066934 [Austropuccinia psidii MF-1]|uniref:Uncharacterized protein n=1 Tax=Austropuccinia psidii MF-1 TaxID=1389203 RepID=A0A9Q3ETY0_9BASI|nr:hypothetical protein [Austropuccinia psidii MF-1]
MLTCLQCTQEVTPMLPPPILMLPHPRRLQSLRSCSTLNPPYAFSHTPNPLCHLPSLPSCSVLATCLQRCSHTGLILNAAYHTYAPSALSR